MLKILIVDDEVPARDELRYLLSFIPDINIVGEAENAALAIELANNLQPDVIYWPVQ